MQRKLIALSLAVILLLGLLVMPVSASYSGAYNYLVSYAKRSGYNSDGIYGSGFYLNTDQTVSYEVYFDSKSNEVEIDINFQDTITVALIIKSSGATPYEGVSALFDSNGNLAAYGTVSVNPSTFTASTQYSSFSGYSGNTNYKSDLLSVFNEVIQELVQVTGLVLSDNGMNIRDLGFTSFVCSSHVFDDGVVTKQPTCAAEGTKTFTCLICGKKDYESIPATGNHKWDGGVTTKPTCVNPGKTVYTCTVCKTTKTDTIPATGVHIWDGGTVDKEPTCTETGVMIYRCATCTNTRSETIPAKGHVWKLAQILTPATEEAHGTARYSCTVCGAVKEADLCAGEVFTDVAKPKFAHAAIDWAWLNNIATGTTPTTFSPNKTVTRGQVVTFLYRLAGEPEVDTTQNPFTDVKPKSYCYKAVLWAVENGITNGTTATTFSPNNNCNRGAIVTFLWRFCGEPAAKNSENPFTDVKPNKFYAKAVLWAAEKGVTTGASPTEFSPAKNCTRAESVTFLFRLANLPLDTEALAAAIAEADALDLGLYTAESQQGFASLLFQAKVLLDNPNATQRQVEEMTRALTAAIEKLEHKPDREELTAAVAEAEALDLSQYTAESQEGFPELLAQAKALLADETASQDQLDEMAAALQSAIEALEPIAPEPTPEPTPVPTP